MVLHVILGALALLSLALTLWQWWVARRFPLHRRSAPAGTPPLTLLKPLKGCDAATAECLRSWLTQDYPGPLQILFGVASPDDPVCPVVRRLLAEHPHIEAQLILCGPLRGANLKVSKLAELERLARHEVLVVSDADVRVPRDFLVQVVAPLQSPGIGLVNCFYRLAQPATLAMLWESIAINADFWSQVLQSRSLRPLDFALGAVMVTRRSQLAEIGGFNALEDCLADDYQLGHRMARQGRDIALCPVVVECWSEPMGWTAVWKHQLRWARTIRVCQPLPYFFSLLSNGTLWPFLWLACYPRQPVEWVLGLGCLSLRLLTALDLHHRLTREASPSSPPGGKPSISPQSAGHPNPLLLAAMVPVKDLLQTAIWLLAFLGNRIEWRGERMTLKRDGTLVRSGQRSNPQA